MPFGFGQSQRNSQKCFKKQVAVALGKYMGKKKAP